VIVGVIGVIRKVTGGDESFEKLLDDGFIEVVVGELDQIGNRHECDHGVILHGWIKRIG
jgi:hypothetical protein